jgi:hypothetical protein
MNGERGGESLETFRELMVQAQEPFKEVAPFGMIIIERCESWWAGRISSSIIGRKAWDHVKLVGEVRPCR